MPSSFDLVITADYKSRTAELRLLDAQGSQLAYRLYVEKGKEAAAMAEIGVRIAEEVLGEDIFTRLWESRSQRTPEAASG